MRKMSFILAAATGLALAAGSAHAQQSWGPKHTTYWNSDATGKFAPGQFMTPTTPATVPAAAPPGPQMQAPARQQRMYYQPATKRVRAPMRVRQQQPGMRPGQPPANAAPSEGQPPQQNQQPGQAPK